MHQILGRVLVHGDLLQDHAPLLVKLPRVQGSVAGQVGQHVHRQRQILVNHPGIEAGAVLAGEGVHLPADSVHFLGNLPGGALLGALEHHVLQEVAQAVLLGHLHHGAHPQPHTNGHRAQVGQPLADDAQAVGKRPGIVHAFIHPHSICHYAFHLIPFLCMRRAPGTPSPGPQPEGHRPSGLPFPGGDASRAVSLLTVPLQESRRTTGAAQHAACHTYSHSSLTPPRGRSLTGRRTTPSREWVSKGVIPRISRVTLNSHARAACPKARRSIARMGFQRGDTPLAGCKGRALTNGGGDGCGQRPRHGGEQRCRR